MVMNCGGAQGSDVLAHRAKRRLDCPTARRNHYDTDNFGRPLGTVTYEGRDIGAWLVREGHAMRSPPIVTATCAWSGRRVKRSAACGRTPITSTPGLIGTGSRGRVEAAGCPVPPFPACLFTRRLNVSISRLTLRRRSIQVSSWTRGGIPPRRTGSRTSGGTVQSARNRGSPARVLRPRVVQY